jgi:mannosyltransferase OCH1-like enzyme
MSYVKKRAKSLTFLTTLFLLNGLLIPHKAAASGESESIIDTSTPMAGSFTNAPTFSSHQQEVNYWIERFKPTQMEIINETDEPITLEWVCKDQPVRPWNSADLTLQAPDGYQFISFNEMDEDGFPVVEGKASTTNVTYTNGCQPIFTHSWMSKTFAPGRHPLSSPDHMNLYKYRLGGRNTQAYGNLSFDAGMLRLFITKDKKSPTGINEFQAIAHQIFYDYPWDKELIYDSPLCKDSFQFFMDNFYEHILGTNEQEVREKRKAQVALAQDVLKEMAKGTLPPERRIPYISHKVWITSDDTPYEVPTSRMEFYFQMVKDYPDFTHKFWCVDSKKIPATIKTIKDSGLNIDICSIRDIWPQIRGKEVLERFGENNRFTHMSDIIRYNLIYLYGGMYSDFSTTFHTNIRPFLDHFDYWTGRCGYLQGNTYIAGKKGNNVYNEFLFFIDNMDRVPNTLRNIHNCDVQWTSTGAFTAYHCAFTLKNERILHIVSNSNIVNFRGMASRLEKKFGQTISPFITAEEYFGNTELLVDYHVDYENIRWLDVSLEMQKKIYGLSLEVIREKEKLIKNSYYSIYYNPKEKRTNRIPHLTHRTWITSKSNPYEVPVDKLENYINSLKTLVGAQDYRHLFWCIDQAKIPRTIELLKKSEIPIEIHEVNEIDKKMKARHIFWAYYKNNQFSLANDVFRLNIINQLGGLYADIGTIFRRDLTLFLDSYDNIFSQGLCGNYIDHGFCASTVKNIILEKHLEVLDTLYNQSDSIKSITCSKASMNSWIGLHHIMGLVNFLATKNSRIFIAPHGITHQHYSMSTWFGEGKFGNTPVGNNSVDILSIIPTKENEYLVGHNV